MQLTIDGVTTVDVTVKAQTVTSLHYNDFSTATTGWTIKNKAGNAVPAIAGGKFNIDIDPVSAAADRTSVAYTMPALISDGIVGFEFDVSNITFTAGSTQIRVAGNLYDAAGQKLGSLNSTSSFATFNSKNGFGGVFFPSASAATKDKVSVKYNPLTGEVWANGSLSSKNLFTFTSAAISEDNPVAKVVINTITITAGSNPTDTVCDIDNFVVYQEVDMADAIKNASDTDKVAYFKGLVEGTTFADVTAVGQVLDLDAEYADYALSECGVAINWTSDNTTYIANNGTVNAIAELGTQQTVNMTATIIAGGVTDTVVFPVTVTDSKTTLLGSTDFSDMTDNESYTTDDEQHGGVLFYTGNSNKAFNITSLNGGGCSDRIVFHADVKYTHSTNESSRGGISILTYGGKAGAVVYFDYNTGKIGLKTTQAYVDGVADGLTVNTDKLVFFDMPTDVINKGEGAWVHIMIDFNALSLTYSVYVDGVLINEVPLLQTSMDLRALSTRTTFRGFRLETSGGGTVKIDNVSTSKYNDTDAVEVNAALNAALLQFGSEYYAPVLVNQNLPAMTIGKSWASNAYNRDLNNGAIKPTNVSTYTYVEDGPQITWTVDSQPATAISVASPKEVQLKVTAAKGGITESKTVTRKVAPAAIRELAVKSNTLNGAWLEGVDGTEKLIVAQYLGDKLVDANVHSLTETTDILKFTTGTPVPSTTAEYNQVKLFLVKADGITPLAYANEELHD